MVLELDWDILDARDRLRLRQFASRSIDVIDLLRLKAHTPKVWDFFAQIRRDLFLSKR